MFCEIVITGVSKLHNSQTGNMRAECLLGRRGLRAQAKSYSRGRGEIIPGYRNYTYFWIRVKGREGFFLQAVCGGRKSEKNEQETPAHSLLVNMGVSFLRLTLDLRLLTSDLRSYLRNGPKVIRDNGNYTELYITVKGRKRVLLVRRPSAGKNVQAVQAGPSSGRIDGK